MQRNFNDEAYIFRLQSLSQASNIAGAHLTKT